MQIVISLLLLSFLILIHELGHFGAARLFKVKVKEFSIFMGPKLFSIKSKKTEYSIRAIPIGGYVAMEGETEQSDDKGALMNKPKWQQAVIMFSGAFMNLLFGLLAFFILTTSSGYMTTNLADVKAKVPDLNAYIQDENLKYEIISPAQAAGLQDGDMILKFNDRSISYPIDILIFSMEAKKKDVTIEYMRDGNIYTTTLSPVVIPKIELYKMGVYFKDMINGTSPQIEEVSADSPASRAGIISGDKIISIDDRVVLSKDDVSNALTKSNGEQVKIKVLRDGKEIDMLMTPEKVIQEEVIYNGLFFTEGTDDFGNRAKASINYYFSVIKSVYFSIGWLITGKVSIRDAMGPVGIVSTIGSVVASKEAISNILKQLLSLMGLISINLGLVNLLPFPALDGSKLVILGIEKISGKRIPIERQAIISLIGFAILVAALIAITSLDIMRLFGK